MISSSITDMKVGEKKCRSRFHDIFHDAGYLYRSVTHFYPPKNVINEVYKSNVRCVLNISWHL